MIIERPLYLSKLIAGMGSSQVKVVTGIRRCGKSFLLSDLFKPYLLAHGVPEGNVFQMAFDKYANKRYRDPEVFYPHVTQWLGATRGGGMRYVMLDEVQLLGDFSDILIDLMSMGDVDVYVTESNSKTLSSDIATNFRDRGQPLHVWPLSFAEWLPASGLTDKQEALRRYMTWGGMPVVALTDDEEEKADYLKRLFKEVYLKDIRERHAVRDDLALENLIDVLASDIGSLTNPHKIGDTMNSLWKRRPSDNTLKNYIEYLEDAFLFGEARRFEVKGRRYLDSPVKYYATDLGLRNARLNFRDTDLSHPMENLIYNDLLRRGYNVDVGVVPISSRDRNGKQSIRQHEIDFIVNRGNDKIYIQSALRLDSRQKEEQETKSLRHTGDFFKKIVITDGYGEPLYDADGILRVGIIPFLLNETFLERL